MFTVQYFGIFNMRDLIYSRTDALHTHSVDCRHNKRKIEDTVDDRRWKLEMWREGVFTGRT
jgi:hypothetical protein